jgi:tripartite-type tricarboxylate transporter receptor subunit TctC
MDLVIEGASMLTKLLTAAATFAWVVCATAPSEAAYPDRPIRLIVPTTAGGGADTLARRVGELLSERLGQPVVIENMPGANGMVGMGHVARSTPDGYTLAVTFTDHFINPSLYNKQPYDLIKDFSPVIYLGDLPFVVVVNPKVPVSSISDLISLARQKPGELYFGSAGTGGAVHMAGELFALMAGVKMTHVPYKGTSAALPDLMSDRIQLMFASAITARPPAEAGSLKMLAVTGARRSPDLPDLPTVAEAGVPGYTSGIWYGIVAPAGTATAIISRLNTEITNILKSPDLVSIAQQQGIYLRPGTPEEFGDFYRAEIGKWAKVVKEAGISPIE